MCVCVCGVCACVFMCMCTYVCVQITAISAATIAMAITNNTLIYVYSDIIFSPAHLINWLHRPRLLPITIYLYAACGICASRVTELFPEHTDLFICPEFWPRGIIDISFQRAVTGKCATPTTHLICQFDYLAAMCELFPSAESKTLVCLLV